MFLKRPHNFLCLLIELAWVSNADTTARKRFHCFQTWPVALVNKITQNYSVSRIQASLNHNAVANWKSVVCVLLHAWPVALLRFDSMLQRHQSWFAQLSMSGMDCSPHLAKLLAELDRWRRQSDRRHSVHPVSHTRAPAASTWGSTKAPAASTWDRCSVHVLAVVLCRSRRSRRTSFHLCAVLDSKKRASFPLLGHIRVNNSQNKKCPLPLATSGTLVTLPYTSALTTFKHSTTDHGGVGRSSRTCPDGRAPCCIPPRLGPCGPDPLNSPYWYERCTLFYFLRTLGVNFMTKQ